MKKQIYLEELTFSAEIQDGAEWSYNWANHQNTS